MNGRTNSSGSSVNDLQIPLDPCTNLECVAGNAQVELTWTDPLNKYATPEGEVAEDPDQLVSVWHHTVVIRKVGSAPVGIDDGIVVVSSEVKNQYQSTAYVDSGLVNDTTYYYGVFAVNEDGVESEGLVSEGVTPKLGTPLSELAEGTIIKINENGSPIEFYLAKHSYEPSLNGEGRELLVRKDLYQEEGIWNSANNRYANSTIDNFLNGSYKNLLSNSVKTLMQTTTFYYTPGNGTTSLSTLQRSVFQLSCTELGIETSYSNTEGTALPNASRYNITAGGIYAPSQWTRSPYLNNNTDVVYVYNSGEGAGAYLSAGRYDYHGYRPCFTLPNTATVDKNRNLLET